jgi:hypothetical protein
LAEERERPRQRGSVMRGPEGVYGEAVAGAESNGGSRISSPRDGLLPSANRLGCVANRRSGIPFLGDRGRIVDQAARLLDNFGSFCRSRAGYEENDEKLGCIVWRGRNPWHVVVELSRKTPPKEPFSLPPPPTSVGGLSFCTFVDEMRSAGVLLPAFGRRSRAPSSVGHPRIKRRGSYASQNLPSGIGFC